MSETTEGAEVAKNESTTITPVETPPEMSVAETSVKLEQSSEGNENKDMFFDQGQWKYRDPTTGVIGIFDNETQTWVPQSTAHSETAGGDAGKYDATSQPAATSSTMSVQENIEHINGIWVHREPTTGTVSTFDNKSGEWVPVPEEDEVDADETQRNTFATEEEEDDFAFQLQQEKQERAKQIALKKKAKAGGKSIYIDPKTGTVYEWEEIRKGWFPEINDDFIARYQASYGLNPLVEEKEKPTVSVEKKKEEEEEKKKAKRKEPAKAEWFEMTEEQNSNVYVSNLPLDITMEEYQELMAKCGLIAQDPRSKSAKLKLYRDSDGKLKGDGLCCYIKKESVDLALKIIDGYQLRQKEIKVELAEFKMKGNEFDVSKKKRKLNARERKEFLEKQNKLFDWRPEKGRAERPKSDSTVIIKNLFTVEEFVENAARLLECEEELKKECSKHGEVKKVVIYESNPEGVASVGFQSPTMADDCVTMMNWKIFRSRQLRAALWDGKTKYRVEETKEQKEARLKNWEQFLTTE